MVSVYRELTGKSPHSNHLRVVSKPKRIKLFEPSNSDAYACTDRYSEVVSVGGQLRTRPRA